MRPYFPGGALNVLTAAREGSIPPTPSAHSLQRGLPGYLIPFAPHAFVFQRQWWPSRPPSPPVFFLISTHSTATPGIPPASTTLESRSFQCTLPVKRRRFHTRLTRPPTHPLCPVNPNNACPLRITAAAGTELAGASFRGTVSPEFTIRVFFPLDSGLRPEGLQSHTRRRSVRVAPIAEASRLLPPVGVWTVSQFQCG